MTDTKRVQAIVSGPVGAPSWRGRTTAWTFKSVNRGVPSPPKPRSTSESRARLSVVLLLYFLGVVGVITLAPFIVSVPSRIHILVTSDWRDVVTNVLLFVPLGFLYPLTRRGEDPSSSRMFLMGALLSATIEAAQLVEAERYASIVDIVTGASGAVVGALLLGAVNRRIRASARLAGRLSLEIPLIGLIYLLVPLLLVASLSALADPPRLLALLPLGLLGARLLSAVQEHHFGPSGVFRNRAMAVVAAGWMVLGIFPVVLRHPLVGSALVLLVALATLHDSSSRPAIRGVERRFEPDVLKSAAPYVAVYFVAVVFLPLALGIGPWHVEVGLTGSGGDPTQQMLRLLEPLASLAVLGYILAEARGRRELPFRKIAWRVVAECTCVAVAIEASRGFQQGAGASVVQFILMIGAALAGAAIYHSQRERVRWILIHRAPAPPIVPAVKLNVW